MATDGTIKLRVLDFKPFMDLMSIAVQLMNEIEEEDILVTGNMKTLAEEMREIIDRGEIR